MKIDNMVLAPLTIKKNNISMYSIILENYIDELNKQDIIKILEQKEDLIDLWIQYSEDKRTNEGWCIEKIFFWYQVYYSTRGGNKQYEKIFFNKYLAVAHYILNEINDIRKR